MKVFTSLFLILISLFLHTSPLLAAPIKNAYSNITLVTDIDDTIKATYVEDKGYTVIHGLFGSHAFAGMSELYAAMGSSYDHVALSGAPDLTRSQLNDFLNDNGFYFDQVFMKPSIWDMLFGSTYTFKLKHLLKIAKQRQGDFILIGDDTEKDPDVYESFSKKFSNRVRAMYIRLVAGRRRKIPGNMIRFRTALDIAEFEFLMDRLPSKDYIRVGEALLNASDNAFLPEFASCPKSYVPYLVTKLSNVAEMKNIRLAVNHRMKKLCNKRCKNPNLRRFYSRENCVIVPLH